MTKKETPSPREVTTNDEQQLFVIPCGGGITCYGYKNCRDEVNHLAGLLGRPDLAHKPENFGKLADYQQYRDLIALYAKSSLAKNIYFGPHVDARVREVLRRAIDENWTVRLHLGEVETGESWNDEFDIIGRVGRTTGMLRSPILVPDGESGGGIVMASCIIRIQRITGALGSPSGHHDVYIHPKYRKPVFTSRNATKSLAEEGYTTMVFKGESNVANFRTKAAADQWIGFMRGDVQTTRPPRRVKVLEPA